MGPAFPLFIALGSLVALVMALKGQDGKDGRDGADVGPLPPLPPLPQLPQLPPPSQFPPIRPTVPPSGFCSQVDKDFIVLVLKLGKSGKATLEQIDKAIALANKCNLRVEVQKLEDLRVATLERMLLEKQKSKKTGKPPKPTNVTKETKDYVCGILPGKGFACRPKNSTWKKLAMLFQTALNVATTKTPGPAETAKLTKVDGRIGPKTALLFQKITPHVPALRLIPSSLATPEAISLNIEELTKQLHSYINSRGGSPSIPSVKEVEKTITSGPAQVSPLPGVSWGQWAEFVRCMAGRGGAKGLGIFKLNPARLKQLGFTKMPSDKRSQVEIFSADVRERCAEILASDLRELVGKEVAPGVPLTLSGLLALCKQAGTKGAASWVMNPEDRERFPNTTEAFACANGIF